MTHMSGGKELVERVARRLFTLAEPPGSDPNAMSLDQDTLLARGEGAKRWEEYAWIAKAAIEATHSQELVEALERHGNFAITMFRAFLVGLECNKGIRGCSREMSEEAEKAFVEALEADRAALAKEKRG